MIPVAPVPEPSGFDERARRPGNARLAENPRAARPRDLWSPFRDALAEGLRRMAPLIAAAEERRFTTAELKAST
jgi:hypothetical protein